jgi:hypothetical protein
VTIHDARANGHGWTAIARAMGTNPRRGAYDLTPDTFGASQPRLLAASCETTAAGGIRATPQ